LTSTTSHTTPSTATLEKVRTYYFRKKAVVIALQGLGMALPLGMWAYKGWGREGGVMAALLLLLLVLTLQVWRWWDVYRKTSLANVAQHLNRKYPQLEESTQLLLQPEAELALLPQLQRQRVATALAQIPVQEASQVSVKNGFLPLLIGLMLATGLYFVPRYLQNQGQASATSSTAAKNVEEPVAQPKAILPAIEQMNIRISPPGYTRKATYAVTTTSFKAEMGAQVTWTVKTNQAVKAPRLVLSNQKPILLRPVANQENTYTASVILTQSTLYHLQLNGQDSEFYSIEVVPDEAPSITVKKPAQYLEILFGQPQRVAVQATLQDDYGLRSAEMVATVAQGEGEAVKFREQRIPLNLSFAGQPRQLQLNQTLDLKKLGMTYGDELYFYLQAYDNHRGYTRTESFLVEIEDTTVVETMDDLSLGVNPNPEYFRSQRQIIIDTEKLIQEQKGLTQAVFADRSNNIGVDQKLLRLRYGKFLGEEFESTIGKGALPEGLGEGHTADDGHDHGGTKGGSEHENKMSELLDPYLHKHDQEEAATFFEPAIKAQLKGALAQMWEAELRLRTNRPKEALPFEYKALRMLKDVQQKSRVYVKKSGFEPPPLKEPEKRLTGDLSKVQTVQQRREEKPSASYPIVRQALQSVENLKAGGKPTQADAALLQQAGQELGKAAVREPGQYLRALQDVRQVVQDIREKQALCQDCLIRVESALHRFLPVSEKTAQKRATPATEKKLSQDYFNRLN
jgi:predicted negative regulator of RcsB-dependent stress response